MVRSGGQVELAQRSGIDGVEHGARQQAHELATGGRRPAASAAVRTRS